MGRSGGVASQYGDDDGRGVLVTKCYKTRVTVLIWPGGEVGGVELGVLMSQWYCFRVAGWADSVNMNPPPS